ncbi:SpoIID/LytB domain-containing protein [Paenibacillus flagellatus]|uniref:SpoIID/LytB domain-containing protein n=1 Tax=Paenibacillus flagellatus TaxID=2211139 RepID=UPI001FE96233|nr:SpoIID/LytB domain-containing protein [Paenibacillus flagellatus]
MTMAAVRKNVHAALAVALLAGSCLAAFGTPAYAASEPSGFTVVRQDGFVVAPGVRHTSMTLAGGGHVEEVNMLEIDPANPVIRLETTSPKGKVVALDTVRNQAKQIDRDGHRVVGAFNMDFYNTDPAYAGIPVGLQVTNGELITAPPTTRSALSVKADGTFAIEKSIAFSGTVTAAGGATKPLAGVNRVRAASGQMVLYSDKFSATTKSAAGGVELVLAPAAGAKLELDRPIEAVVESVAEAGNSAIPPGKLVLSAAGADADWLRANAAVGRTLTFRLGFDKGLNDAVQAVSGGVMLVENGAATPEALADNDRHPRTFVAAKAGKLYVLTFDGRQPTYSDGVTLSEGARYLEELGMEKAINVDGGGSTTYAVRLPGDTEISVVNSPSDGYERANSNSLAVVSTAPVTELATLVPQPKGPIRVVAGSTVRFGAKGQDASYNGVPVDAASLVWQADAAIGTIAGDGTFAAAAAPGTGSVTVRSGTVSAQVAVDVVTAVARLTLSPSPAVVNPGATQTFVARAFDAEGRELIVSPERLTWSAEGGIGTLSAAGVLTATNQVVAGKVKASYGNVQAEASVNVGKPPIVLEDFEELSDIAVSSARANSVKLDLTSRPNPVRYGTHAAKLSYDFTGTIGTSAAYMNFKDAAGAAGKPIEDYPTKIGVWVYGDGNKHWLRGQVQDGTGTKKPIDFTGTGELNWTGWKYVTADIPTGMALPLRLTQVYVVETSNANKNAGAVYFDQLRAVYSDIGEDLEGPAFSGLAPAPNAKVYTNRPEISLRVADEGQGVDPGLIVMKLNGTVVPHLYDAASGKVSYTPAAALADGTYAVAVDASDKAGNPAVPNAAWSFTVYTGPDTEAPSLAVIAPMDGITTRTEQPRLAVKATDGYTGVDPTKLALELDGAVVPHEYDEASGTLYYTAPAKLQPNSTHAVKATAADKAGNAASIAWSFTVGAPLGQPADPNKFQMSVIGDGGYYTAGQGQTAADILLREQINRINAESSELIGYTGDIVENDTAANYATAVQNMNLFDAPYVVSIGNHEISGTGSRLNYQRTFGEPTYLYDYGNTRIIGLDSANNTITGSDASQWPWLAQVLESTEQRNVFVFMHVPPDEISAEGEDFKTGHGFNDPVEAQKFYDLLGGFKSSHPDTNVVVFSGDLHAYLHKKVQGVDYVISGGGGKYTHIPAEKGGFYHYLNVRIDDASVEWDVVPLLESISFRNAPAKLGIGGQAALVADGKFMTSTNEPITLPVGAPFKTEWVSSDPAVAEVDGQGVVKAKAAGTAAITVKAGNREAQTTIQVVDAPAGEELELSGLTPMSVGDALQATTSYVLIDGTRVPISSGVAYSTEDANVAVVSAGGIVTALGEGQTVVKAVYGGKSASVALQVAPYEAPSIREKIMAKDTAARTIEPELTGSLPLSPGLVVFQTANGVTRQATLGDVMVGATNVSAYRNKAGQVYKLLIDGETPVDGMRVGIRKDISNIADMTQIDHPSVELRSVSGIRLTDKIAGRTFDVPADTPVVLTPEAGQLKVTSGGAELYRTANRLYAAAAAEAGLVQIASITRAHGKPQYRGTLELTLSPSRDKLRVVNEVGMEQYLYQVVPSEMPVSFGLEALKAQAVAARTYALTDYESSRFADKGFHIDDSTLSQVYNNQAEFDLTTQAVNETSGLIMRSGGGLVDARFYSTSGGFGASKHEVWADSGTNAFPGTPVPYLTGRSYTYDPADPSKLLQLDTHDEAQLNAFYKTLSHTGYDSESLYFRWKVSLSRAELEKTINANLAGRYAADPLFILTRADDGGFVSKPIPAAGIGTLKNMYVAGRGQGGNITELVVEGTTGTYKIVKEYNIRFTIRPSKTYTGGADVLAYRAKGGSTDYDPAGTLRNPSILYSAFFTFDLAKDASGAVTGVTFYGGGNGHGVGMSQYGASMLGGKGWSFDRILDAYYNGMSLVPINGPKLELTGIRIDGLAAAMKPGESKQATVTALYSDGSSGKITAGVTFTSGNPQAAGVSGSGLVTASGYGTATISATYQGRTATFDVRIDPPFTGLRLDGLAPMIVGETKASVLNAVYADGTVTRVTYGAVYTSSNPQVASVDGNGVVTALQPGTTEIAAAYQGQRASYELQVSPKLVGIRIDPIAPMKEGDRTATVVRAVYSDGGTVPLPAGSGVAFASSKPSVATVDLNGVVTALDRGGTTVTAAWNGFSASADVQVTSSILVLTMPPVKPLKAGETAQLSVTARYWDGTVRQPTEGVTYTSSDPSVASVDASGTLRAHKAGVVTVRAQYGTKTAWSVAVVIPVRK